MDRYLQAGWLAPNGGWLLWFKDRVADARAWFANKPTIKQFKALGDKYPPKGKPRDA
jgi:hypothetical protein